MVKFFEQEYASISYDEAIQAMILQWKVTATSSEYRNSLNHLLLGMEQYKTSRVVVDTRHLGVIHPDDQEWSISDWTVRAMQSGYTHLAIILPDGIFTKIVCGGYNEHGKSKTLLSRYFSSLDEAKNGLSPKLKHK